MSEVPVWSCNFNEAKEPGAAALDSLTVGTKFILSCRGDLSVYWTTEPPKIKFKEGDAGKPFENSLVILEVLKQEALAADFLVTAYKPGDHKPEFLRVVQGDQGFEVLKPAWSVKSVIQPNPEKPPEPYPSFGPWGLSLPLWVTLLLVAVIGLFSAYVYRRVRKANQRRRMLEDLKLHQTVLQPIHQFYKDARKLRTKMHQVKPGDDLKPLALELEREFKLYILRQYQIPALEWSDREILRDLSYRHRQVYKKAGELLKKTLRELGRLHVQKNLGMQDLEQMHRMSLDTAESLDAAGAGET